MCTTGPPVLQRCPGAGAEGRSRPSKKNWERGGLPKGASVTGGIRPTEAACVRTSRALGWGCRADGAEHLWKRVAPNDTPPNDQRIMRHGGSLWVISVVVPHPLPSLTSQTPRGEGGGGWGLSVAWARASVTGVVLKGVGGGGEWGCRM